jgi:hypothetical protein
MMIRMDLEGCSYGIIELLFRNLLVLTDENYIQEPSVRIASALA